MNKPASNLVIASDSFGYVIENFKGECKITGKQYAVLTTGGRPIVYPNKFSIPPKFRPYARKATFLEASQGYRAPRVVIKKTYEQMQDYKKKNF